MIEMAKTYRTSSERSVRVLCTDGPNEEYPVVALVEGDIRLYSADGLASILMDKHSVSQHKINSLVESDPHGILPRHRELLWAVCNEIRDSWVPCGDLRYESFENIPTTMQAALIALARLDREKGE